ncbi:MAG: tetratricopeptide repeat protein [Fimbriiglobus sp.]
MISYKLPIAILALAALSILGFGADKAPPAKPVSTNDGEEKSIQRVVTAREEYQKSLIALYDHYSKANDREHARWVEDELRSYHVAWKPSYSLELQDPLPENPSVSKNDPEANELFKTAMIYKGKKDSTEFVLNQRRSEILLQDILRKSPESDKLADVAYELADLYEGKAYKQYERAARYYEHAAKWRKGTRSDALIRAARLHDRVLNDRKKAIELYRKEIQSDTDVTRVKEAEKRLAELTSTRR